MKKARLFSLLFAILIIAECLACAVPAFAAPEASGVTSLLLGVTPGNFGMSAKLYTDYINYTWETGDYADAPVKFYGEKYPPFYDGSEYYYKFEAYNAEYDYGITIREYSNALNSAENLTNKWEWDSVADAELESFDIYVKEGYYYTIDFIKGEAYTEDNFFDEGCKIYFWLPEIYDVSSYTDALEDLSRDESFDVSNYPTVSGSYDMDIIQIAEDSDNNLFVYAYDPSGLQTASKINMALQHYESNDLSYKLYDLIPVSSSGTLSKYIVKDFVVSEDECRFYNIAAVYTPFNSSIHTLDDQSKDDITNYKGYAVGKCFAAYSYNNKICYDCVKVDVVDVDILGTGCIRYQNGFNLSGIEYTDSHFVVFDIKNYDVTHIYDATITYTTRSYSYTYAVGAGVSNKLGDPVLHEEEIFDSDTGKTFDGTLNLIDLLHGRLLTGVSYEWNRILTVEDFNNQINSYSGEVEYVTEDDYSGSAWVFQFLETPYTTWSTLGVGNGYYSTRVSEVAILRLRFAAPTSCYNLGCVSDVVSDDGEPDITVTPRIGDGYEDLEAILALVLLIALIVIIIYFLPVITSLFKAVFKGFAIVISALLSIVELPFKIIFNLFSNKRDR